MDTLDAERLERKISELENYVLSLEQQVHKLNSKEQIIVEDTVSFNFLQDCECCGVKHTYKTRSVKESSYNFKESSKQQSC